MPEMLQGGSRRGSPKSGGREEESRTLIRRSLSEKAASTSSGDDAAFSSTYHLMNKWFIFYQSELILTDTNEIPTGEQPPIALEPWNRRQVLPSLDGATCIAVEIDHPLSSDVGLKQMGLRQTFDHLSSADYRMAGKARELLYWNSRTRYCGSCGAPLEEHTEISKKCPQCQREYWPSPSPAVIILIERRAPGENRDDDEVLLVQARNFSGDYYGLVAGFCETGETLEESARREILEETGLQVKNLRYCASQPWPYPSVLMVGYVATYESGELSLQRSELRKGQWFKRKALPQIPGKVSLARQLIDRWIEQKL